MITGAEAIVKCLEKEGIKCVFGYPGVAICPLYDSLYQSNIKHILVRTEQNAGHAANGYARISRKPAVCITTSGPGATNLITALATAYADSIPMVAITGQVSSEVLGKDGFQEADITGAAEPFLKYSYLVRDANDIPRIMNEAFYIAASGRPGPVLIDIPIDMQKQKIEFSIPKNIMIRGYKPTVESNIVQMNKVINAIRDAERPLLCIGGGVILGKAEEAVKEFCEQYQIPVVSTLMGTGIMPARNPLYFGMIGANGKSYANKAVVKSDLLIIAGARVADRAVIAPEQLEQTKLIIHIDVDPAEIGKIIGTTIPLVGDVRYIFNHLIKFKANYKHEKWLEELNMLKANYVDGRNYHKDYINPCLFVQKLTDKMEENSVYVADVGQNQMWSADNYIMKNGRFLTTGGFGTMGYSIPAAIGAKMAAQERQVIAVCGDGSFQMAFMELATMKQHDVPIKIIVMKNTCLGLVREYQQNNYEERYIGVSLEGSPKIEKIAEAYEMSYFKASHMEKLDNIIDAFLDCEGPAVMECEVYKFDTVKE